MYYKIYFFEYHFTDRYSIITTLTMRSITVNILKKIFLTNIIYGVFYHYKASLSKTIPILMYIMTVFCCFTKTIVMQKLTYVVVYKTMHKNATSINFFIHICYKHIIYNFLYAINTSNFLQIILYRNVCSNVLLNFLSFNWGLKTVCHYTYCFVSWFNNLKIRCVWRIML